MKRQKILLIIIIPILIILFSFRVNIFDLDYYKTNLKQTGVFEEVDNANFILINILNYLEYGTDLNQKYFTQDEITHLQDARKVIWNSMITLAFLVLIFIIILFITMLKKKIHLLGDSFFIGSIISLTIAIILLILSSINFSQVFYTFHKLIFTNDLWLLPSSSTLIQIFPLDFFYTFAKKILLNIIYLSLFLGVIGFGSKFVKRD